MAKQSHHKILEEEVLKYRKTNTCLISGQPGADLACVRVQSWKHWQKKVIM